MKPLLAPFLALLLAGCGVSAAPTATAPTRASLLHLDAGTAGGLAADMAAHPSVQLARPLAYALAPEAAPFLAALDATVVPSRKRIAERLRADAAMAQATSGPALFTAVNTAQAQAQRTIAPGRMGQERVRVGRSGRVRG